MAFKSARNYERKLRLALMGPPKSGKSFTALTIAHALAGEGGKVAVIDTENASAAKYAELFPPFDVSELEKFNPDDYVKEIYEAERLGYDVLIIDSLTHAWNGPGGLLEYKDQVAKSGKAGMNSYTAWSEASPKHTRLMYAITHSKLHVIVTLRTKVEYVLEDRKGKQVPVKIGLAPIQRDETEYEFDIMGTMDKQHTLTIDDSRCPGLDNVSIPIPDGSVATTIKSWLAGEPMPEPVWTVKTAYERCANRGDVTNKVEFYKFASEVLGYAVTAENVMSLDQDALKSIVASTEAQKAS